MKQNKPDISKQMLYLGRYVDRGSFRAYVYSDKEEKLATSADEFESLIASGVWFDTKENALAHLALKEKPRKPKDGAAS